MDNGTLKSNKKIVECFAKAINDRRVDALTEFMAHDVIDLNKIIYGEADEPGAAFEGIHQQLAAFNPYSLRIDELIAEDDRVVARITQSGTHSGTHPRMPKPTNLNFENEAIFVFTVKNNKITEIRAVSDRLGLFLQLDWEWPSGD